VVRTRGVGRIWETGSGGHALELDEAGKYGDMLVENEDCSDDAEGRLLSAWLEGREGESDAERPLTPKDSVGLMEEGSVAKEDGISCEDVGDGRDLDMAITLEAASPGWWLLDVVKDALPSVEPDGSLKAMLRNRERDAAVSFKCCSSCAEASITSLLANDDPPEA